MDAKILLKQLRNYQESKGYFFNQDNEMTMALMESLLINKERYGYMACPCRLANGAIAQDSDIVCPCIYRDDDIREYGTCFCGLYVSYEWNAEKIPHKIVPERRPPEKIL